MVTKTFCDRCDNDITNKKDNEFFFSAEKKSAWGYDKRMNFCDKCMEEFKEWLKI